MINIYVKTIKFLVIAYINIPKGGRFQAALKIDIRGKKNLCQVPSFTGKFICPLRSISYFLCLNMEDSYYFESIIYHLLLRASLTQANYYALNAKSKILQHGLSLTFSTNVELMSELYFF